MSFDTHRDELMGALGGASSLTAYERLLVDILAAEIEVLWRTGLFEAAVEVAGEDVSRYAIALERERFRRSAIQRLDKLGLKHLRPGFKGLL